MSKQPAKSCTSKDGTTIAYEMRGSGEKLLCIFGATCYKDYFAVQSDIKEFAKHFSVINYDRRGRGESGGRGSWTIDKELDDIEALIEAVGAPVHLYGHSSGAVLALEAGLRFPEKVKTVTVYDVSYVSSVAEQQEYRALKERVEKLLQNGDHGAALKVFLQGIGMPRLFSLILPLMPGWRQLKKLAPTLRHDIALTEVLPPAGRLARLKVPSLILVGEKNPPSLMANYRLLTRSIPGARGKSYPGKDHLASAAVFIDDIRAFHQLLPGYPDDGVKKPPHAGKNPASPATHGGSSPGA